MNTERLNPVPAEDVGWKGEDSTRQPVLLAPGMASRLDNLLAVDGVLTPRPGVSRPDWGCPLWSQVTMSFGYSVTAGVATMTLTGANATAPLVGDLLLGQTLTGTGIAVGATVTAVNAGALTLTMSAVATGDATGTVVLTLTRATFDPAAVTWIDAARFADSTGVESVVVLIHGKRSDGGSGRCFRIMAGSLALEIPLNGFDLWEGARLVPCGLNGILCLRPGNRRWYFQAADVNLATDQITLHVTPTLVAGSQVSFHVAGSGSVDPLVNETTYWTSVAGSAVRLHPTQADAMAGINQINLTAVAGSGWWYLQQDEPNVRPESNWGDPLILQPTTALEMWDTGWAVVPSQLAITDAVVATDVWEVPNHRLLDGDKVSFKALTGIVTVPATVPGTDEWWVAIESEHRVKLYQSQEAALERNAAKVVNVTVTGTGVMKNSGATDLPIPPARLGLFHKGRVFLVTGQDRLVISDVNDPIHFSPLVSEARIEDGQGKPIVALAPYLEDSLLVFKADEVHRLDNVSQDMDQWSANAITKKYGCLAERGVVAVGNDVWFVSQVGIASVRNTEYGRTVGTDLPASEAIAARMAGLDGAHLAQAQAAAWNNLVFFALPGTAQTAPVRNTVVLVWSTINQAWQGQWTGETLRPIQWVSHQISGREVLLWLDPTGWMRYFRTGKLEDNRTDGYDTEAPIIHGCTTRGYAAAPLQATTTMHGVQISMSTWNPRLEVWVVPDGVAEERPLLRAVWTRERTRYQNWGQPAYDPSNVNDDWGRRYRQDYSVPLNVYLGSGIRLDQHQDAALKLPVTRASGRPIQFRLLATQGSVRVRGLACVGDVGRVNGRQD